MITGGEEEENRDFNWYGNPLKHTFPLCPTLFTNIFFNILKGVLMKLTCKNLGNVYWMTVWK